MELTTAQMAAMKMQKLVPRGLANQESSSVPMAAAYHQAMCVMPRTTVEMVLMSRMKPAVSLTGGNGSLR